MRALVLDRAAPVDARPLAERELPDPSPGPGQILIEVSACAVCRTDLHVVEGDLPPAKLPVIPGHQVVGRVAAHGPATAAGDGAAPLAIGARVGVAWLHDTCGACAFCATGRENLCEAARFSGRSVDGGFATRMLASAAFVYPLSDALPDVEAAPLLCAGIIGHRALALGGVDGWPGARVGIYGFGAAGHLAIQIARARGAEVFVCTRDRERHQALARELGAAWVGGTLDEPPAALDAAIVFAPAGEIVPAALAAVRPGGTVVLGGIHMSPIPALPYERLYRERVLRSVTNNTRADGRAFLAEAARHRLRVHARVFPLSRGNDALIALKHDAIRGAAVLTAT